MPKKEIPEDEGVDDAWLASYADAMTLLLAFFIMMYAFALVDLAKFQDLKIGVSAAFGHANPVTDNTESILDDGTGLLPELGFNPAQKTGDEQADEDAMREALGQAGTITPDNAEDLRQLLESEFDQLGAADLVEVGIDERGIFIRFDGRVLFASGSADLDEPGTALLATAADVLDLIDNPLEIEGHTDNQPTSGQWPSNWELSSARASRVVRWMIDSGGLPDPQMMAVGRADTRPRDDNSTEEGRRSNRRVEIVVRVAGIAGSDTASPVPLGDGPIGDDPIGIGRTDADTDPPDVLGGADDEPATTPTEAVTTATTTADQSE